MSICPIAFQNAYRRAWLAEEITPKNAQLLKDRHTSKLKTPGFKWVGTGNSSESIPKSDAEGNPFLTDVEQVIIRILPMQEGATSGDLARIAKGSEQPRSIAINIQRLKSMGMIRSKKVKGIMRHTLTEHGRNEKKRRAALCVQ